MRRGPMSTLCAGIVLLTAIVHAESTWVETSVPYSHGEISVQVWSADVIAFEEGPLVRKYPPDELTPEPLIEDGGLLFTAPSASPPMFDSDSITFRDTMGTGNVYSTDTVWYDVTRYPTSLEPIGEPLRVFGTPDSASYMLYCYWRGTACPFTVLDLPVDNANKIVYFRCGNGTGVKLQVSGYSAVQTEQCGSDITAMLVRWACDSAGNGVFRESVATGKTALYSSRTFRRAHSRAAPGCIFGGAARVLVVGVDGRIFGLSPPA